MVPGDSDVYTADGYFVSFVACDLRGEGEIAEGLLHRLRT